jgi:hypothetical protein
MSRVPRMPVFDPFFDSNGDANLQPPSSLVPQSAPVPGTEHYRSPREVVMSSGRNAAELMRPGVMGLQGVVVPHATLGGVPAGMRPHDIGDMQINVDPHIPGQNAIINLADINPRAMRQASQLAGQVTPEPTDAATLRLRASATMHGIVAGAQRNGGSSRNDVPPQQAGPAGYMRAPNLARVATPQQRRSSPLQSFLDGSNASHERATYGREMRAIDIDTPSVVSQPPAGTAEPALEVIFQLQGFGEHRAYFHDVVVEPGFMVLIYRTGYRGSKWFPPVSPEPGKRPIAINIAGTTEVYLVHTTGVQYVYGETEHCVLMVERVGQLPSDDAPQEE